ncbi:PREDICTED: low affinity immunoglobulin epsilon Fc receptor isoform X1 [Capra hircus]|uniref:low affinity immunoglobulin epsilon Fc receptor isoform X1 n=1 Tax=Capra hircus TaxID=9925 RepID=UPI0006B13243|nr:PREDICTED: low affinity immunoglobulin epsilon Fc receptor isoform X1 [Capra hircus]
MTPQSRAEGRGPRPAMEQQEFTKFSRRRRPCCCRGTQLALLALVTTALWAGLLTLLLLWHWESARNLKQLEETAAQNVSQVSKDLERHKGDQMAQKSQAAQMMQNMERIQTEQKRMESQESELSWNLDGLRADLSDLKSRGLNEMRQALDSLGRLQEEVGKLWIELRASNAQTPGEMLPPTLPVVPTAPAIALSTVPNTASTLVPTTTTSTTASTTVPSTTATTTATTTETTMVPTTATTTVPTTAAPLSLSSTPGSVCNTCPEAWIYFQKKCYYFGEGAKKWIQARYACEDLDGRLVSIHSPEEQDFLTKRANWRGSWIGLRDLDIEGEFIWMDNQPLDYSNWQPGEPNDGGQGENCVMMLGSGKWNDAFCGSDLHGWVCDRLATC